MIIKSYEVQKNYTKIIKNNFYLLYGENVGLKKCMKEVVPIGIIIQTDKKPNTKYKIMGTGIVKKWEEGYYFIDVFKKNGEI